MTDARGDKTEFHWELLKLLLQVAWADDEVHPAERRLIVALAWRLGVNEQRIAELESHLDGTGAYSLPPPNFALLRSRKEEAMEAASQIVLADGDIHDSENELMAELHALLNEGAPGP